ncbi:MULTISPECIES: hypothetical protein [Pseudomonas]|jgi:hypothetical protein|uniref:DUF3509 domain-containing protein n=1 Tax=Pseudomonas oryzihabitans TaxID=47885 RepID=A0A2Z5A7P7_9PSED|nr:MULTISPECIES: hypothetical protein [Pseudomonas]AXA65370.1 hypothetical protein CE139_05950 [Pseudomonas oryzihabitans]
MQALRSQLAALDPPIKHEIQSQGDNLLITLIDPARPARVSRTLNQTLVRNTALLYEVIRDAINELRAGGSLPDITAADIYPDS